MRIVMFGTGPFAVPTFRSLIESDHEVSALFTRPISDAGKRRKTAENPTRDVGEEVGLRICDPTNVNESDSIDILRSIDADLFVVCDYGQILSRECLGCARLGGINLHGSLLPKYRGAAPIQWAIYNGDSVTGVTIIHMTSKLDGGPCLVQTSTDIHPEETAETIEPRLATLGVPAVHEAIKMLSNWDGDSSIGEKQDPSAATKAPRLKKSDGLIDWSKTTKQIVNQIRAFQPWPGSFSNWHSENRKQPVRLIVHDSNPISLEQSTQEAGVAPGRVVRVSRELLIIRTGDGGLSITKLQPAGKKPMPIADFLRGNQPEVGDEFK